MGLRSFGEREHAIDRNLQLAVCDVVDQGGDHGEAAIMLLRKDAGIVHALDISAVRPEHERVKALGIAAGHADHDGTTPIFQGGDAARQVAARNAVDHEVHALASCLGLDRFDEVLPGVVDRDICAEFRREAREFAVVRGGGEHPRTRPLRELQARKAKRAGAGMYQNLLAFLQVAELEQAFMGCAEGDGDRSGDVDTQGGGNDPGHIRRRHRKFGVRAPRCVRARCHDGHDLLTDRTILHTRTNLDDLASALVTDDVRNALRRHDFAGDKVPALD
jgi:hypothetical protein